MTRLAACTGITPVKLAALLAALFLGMSITDARADAGKPNIVLIMTDDEDVAIHAFMPKTKALLHDQGTTFKNFFVTYPFCCPSRATILRGQYGHNTGILGNRPPLGGYAKFRDLGHEKSTLATWLQAAGYRTAMVGKYLNGYAPRRHTVPLGWDDWYVASSGAHPSYNYWLNENGRAVWYGDRPEEYLNDVLTNKSVQIIRKAAKDDEPFFLYVLPLTPHSPSTAAPRHLGLFKETPLPRSPSFDSADVSSKPAYIRNLPPLDAKRLAHMKDEYRRRLRSLQAIDDMVERIVATLEATGQLDNTYIVYSSDNGFHIGEHRLPAGKDFPYEEDIRVPMVMRGPGVPKGHSIDALALNTDFAPTFAEIAGATTPDFVDGRSFLPLLENPDRPWRHSFLIQRRQLETQYLPFAKRQGLTGDALERAAHFNGLRTRDATYVEYGTGERELYELRSDPFQLSNLAKKADPALLAALSARLAKLAACAGAECRRLEDLPVETHPGLLSKAPAAPVVPAAAKD